MRLVFVRHGESEGNAEERLQGHADYGLTPTGRAQSQELRERFRNENLRPTHIYSSPLRRAAETVQIVTSIWPIQVTYWGELKEQDIGVFSGLTWDEISAKYPEVAQQFQMSRDWEIVDGAETLESLRDRGRHVLLALKALHTNDDAVLVFTHGGILQHMVAELMGTGRTWEISVHNTALFEFILDIDQWPLDGAGLKSGFRWSIVHFNDASHSA